jgi:hypothetical protein
VGLGRFFVGYLLLGKCLSARPYKIYRDSAASNTKKSICVNPHLRLGAFMSGLKKPDYMVGADLCRLFVVRKIGG